VGLRLKVRFRDSRRCGPSLLAIDQGAVTKDSHFVIAGKIVAIANLAHCAELREPPQTFTARKVRRTGVLAGSWPIVAGLGLSVWSTGQRIVAAKPLETVRDRGTPSEAGIGDCSCG